MADTITTAGLITSFDNTPQANPDEYSYTEDSSTYIWLDVMSNDLGGKAKTLYSIDTDVKELLDKDSAIAECSTLGAKISIALDTTDNKYKIKYEPGHAFDYLAEGQTATDTFYYAIRLANGALSWDTVTVHITGTNDAAVITGDTTGSVIEASGVANGTAGTSPATGDLDATDVDSSADFVVQSGVAKTYGTFSINAAGEWSYTLDETNAAVQALNTGSVPLHEFVTVKTADGTEQVIDITINGANDAAVITGATTGTVTEASGVANETAGTSPATGDLNATDVDSSADFVAQSGVAKTYGTFSIDATGAWSYTLDEDNATVQALNTGSVPLHELVTVATADGTTQVIDITINGANDAAVITGNTTGTVDEDAVPNTVSGNLDSTDVDNTDDAFLAVVVAMASDQGFGTYTVAADGHWTYTVDNSNPTVDALNESSVPLTDTFTVYSEDGTAQLVTITITGTTDSSVVTVPLPYTGTGDPNDYDDFNGLTPSSGKGAITGTKDDDILAGSTDNDTANGNNGDDTIYGGAGNDQINGNGDNDILYGGSGNDTLNGGGGLDTLYGGSGSDAIIGDTSDDLIIGGYGADTLTGNGGNDTFKYLSILDTGDVLTDFDGAGEAGGDIIDLSEITVTNAFGGTTATANGTWYSTDGTNATIYVDTDGITSTAEFAITLNNVTTLTAGDILT